MTPTPDKPAGRVRRYDFSMCSSRALGAFDNGRFVRFSDHEAGVARLRGALSGLLFLCRNPYNANESFERVGEAYYRDSGHLRPGKDEPFYDTSCPENVERFRVWIDAQYLVAWSVAQEALSPNGGT